jgi:ribonuclease Z
LVVLEATFANDAAAAAEVGHMTAAQAGELAARAGAKRLLLTHLLPDSHVDLAWHAAQSFEGPVDIAREGFTYEHR